jgi:AraC-like DNA-binding protein
MHEPAPRPRTIVQHWRTRDVEEAAIGLSERFCNASRFKFEGSRDAFRHQCSWAKLTDARIIRASNTGYEVDAFLNDEVFIAFTMQGGVSLETGNERTRSEARAAGVTLRPGHSYHYTMPRGAAVFGLQLPVEALARQASLIFDGRVTVDVGAPMNDRIDITGGTGAALFRNVAVAFKEIEMLDHVGLGVVAEASLSELLTNLALINLIPDVRSRLEAKPRDVCNGTIERARQYIEAHSEGPIRMAELARDLGVSLRALQAAFQRQLGRSPTEYLFECRLMNVRQHLLNAPEGATVTSIATECGFVNLGAFSARYRNAFGELPSETLYRRRRGHWHGARTLGSDTMP